MENFTLWGFSYERASSTLNFFATMVNLQRIHHGTRELMNRMLEDAGFTELVFTDGWTIHPFLTDYLTDDPESPDWEDIWLDTWEIHLPIRAMC
ncbi:MAG: hypothetical protein M3Z04_11020 [Chloroflexota bacterium]|nr:hypothetical protein [Chloroflexota bacterium]